LKSNYHFTMTPHEAKKEKITWMWPLDRWFGASIPSGHYIGRKFLGHWCFCFANEALNINNLPESQGQCWKSLHFGNRLKKNNEPIIRNFIRAKILRTQKC
jgi:hypothetical protein